MEKFLKSAHSFLLQIKNTKYTNKNEIIGPLKKPGNIYSLVIRMKSQHKSCW